MPTEFLPRTYGNSAEQARISGLHASRFPRGCVIHHILGVPVISNEVRNPTVARGRRRGRFLPTVEMTASLIRGFHTASPAGEARFSWHPDGRSEPPGRLVKDMLTFPLKHKHISSKTCSRFRRNASTFFHASFSCSLPASSLPGDDTAYQHFARAGGDAHHVHARREEVLAHVDGEHLGREALHLAARAREHFH